MRIKETKQALAQKSDRNKEYRNFCSPLSEIVHSSAVGLRHYVVEGDMPGSFRLNPSGSLYNPELLMALASSTQLEIIKIIREIRADPVDEEFQTLQLENGRIIYSVRQRPL